MDMSTGCQLYMLGLNSQDHLCNLKPGRYQVACLTSYVHASFITVVYCKWLMQLGPDVGVQEAVALPGLHGYIGSKRLPEIALLLVPPC